MRKTEAVVPDYGLCMFCKERSNDIRREIHKQIIQAY
jgi:hypothetical protein